MDIATPVDRHRIFDDPWCPLYGKIPDVLNGSGDELTGQCIRIIEESRKIWMCAAISEEKLKTAKELWDLFRIHHNLVSNGHTQNKLITTESICETIVTESRKLSFSSLDKIADTEILAMYTIHVVFSALKDLWEPLDKMGIDHVLYPLYSSPLLDEDSFIKAEIYIARLLLSQAKKMANQIQKKTVDKITPFPLPPNAIWIDLKMTIIGYDKTVKIEVKDGKTITTNYKQMGFEDGRKGKPNDAWKRLAEFAYNKGILTEFSSTKKSKIEKDVQEIRRTLSECFEINGKAIPDYRHGEGYKTAFKISYHDEQEQKSKELSNFDDNKDDIDF